MDVERVAAGRAGGPTGPSEGVATDDGAEPLEQRCAQARLDGWQRDPAIAHSHDTVTIELGTGGLVGSGPAPQRDKPAVYFSLRRWHADPVLEAAVGLGGRDARIDEQEMRDAIGAQCAEALGFTGPLDQHNIHGGKVASEDCVHVSSS